MKKRIWELDAFRGLCILGMVLVHLVYDVVYLYKLIDWDMPAWFSFIQNWGGVLFVALSGACVTLGHRNLRRGLIVLGCGLLVSAVTIGLYELHLFANGIQIYFGVLHCLGICMILWSVLKKLPNWALAVLAALIICIGFTLCKTIYVDSPCLLWLGFLYKGFFSSDYFPLLPNLGYFLLGSILGRTLYRNKESLFPKVNPANPVVRFLSFCGRQSLWIYLLHQPILSGAFYLFFLLK